ncbi:MAG: hypothetical protein ACLU0O_10820 [Collinsella sp.]
MRPETKERVRAAMRELGYRPNFAGRSLRRGKFKTVGVAMFNITGTGNLDRMEGFAAAADKHGYAITLTKVDGHPYTLESASSRMSALPVDGMVVIMNRMPADLGTFEPLPGMQTVLVTMLEHPLCSTVDNDQFDCSRQVVEYLLEQGHKTVHFISCPERSLSACGARKAGARHCAHGIEPPRLIRGDWTAQSGYAAGQALADDPTCTAIYASTTPWPTAAFADSSRAESGARGLSVVGVDDSLGDIVPDRRLTTVRF